MICSSSYQSILRQPHAGSLFAQEFLQCLPRPAHPRGGVLAHIAVVPGFVADAGDVGFVGGIALYEAVLVGVLGQPGVLLGAKSS